MTTIKIEETEYSLPTSWDELNWTAYIGLLNLEADREKYLVDIMYTQRYLEILCGQPDGTFDEMECSLMAELEQLVFKNFDAALLIDIAQTTDHFIINGITYSFYSPNTFGSITSTEQSFIKMAEMQSVKQYDHITKGLAVLIRPATKTTNKEGLTKWKLDKFDRDDVEHREKILVDNLKLPDLIMVSNFFLSLING